MNIPKEIIEKAKEAGWRLPEPCELDGIEFYHDGDTALDPTFWQSLGKSLGWPEEHRYYSNGENWAIEARWIGKARTFYDLILQGKPTEEFWKELIG